MPPIAAFTVPAGKSNSGPSNFIPFSLTDILSSKRRRPSTYFSVVGELHWNWVASQNRFRYGTLAGLVQVAMAGVVPKGADVPMVQPSAADTAFLFTAPVTLSQFAS